VLCRYHHVKERKMKRMVCAAALAVALTFAGGGCVLAHTITVENNGAGVVHQEKDLARGITPRIFPDGPDPGDAPDSAASQGTNTACEAIPEDSAVTIKGGSC
jgi:hypothetical protein